MELKIESLIRADSELTHQHTSSIPIILSTRIRLARNLAGHIFPNQSTDENRNEVFEVCRKAIEGAEGMDSSVSLRMEDISEMERKILVERHLVSRELIESQSGAGVVINGDQSCAVMINEEDHLRIQSMLAGFHLDKVWTTINALDNSLEETLDFAYSEDLGFLTACPSNVGTGLRASVMMHLPGLVITKNMEKVIRAVNQIGLVVRGWLGEGSDASGSIFQISNQQTLGESEEAILKRLANVLKTVRVQEENARMRLLQTDRNRILDRIGRAYGILRNGHLLSSGEGMSLLSLIRLGTDFGMFPKDTRCLVDRLFIEAQPAHVQYLAESEIESAARDALRASSARRNFSAIAEPDYDAAPS
ncbi:protein arginine kinase [Puniceicoccus vermicola]|uniref:Protein arginine kinase n=1 Tax=Puniceicoccus vermicola TaxID=388746 RepID=A0A7X1B259_9BACT|nr:protein arginine kinase [Puniceicoccus vermicola]MBC2604259.1 protein arginine kinase [Puniceicoccus vermicola]